MVVTRCFSAEPAKEIHDPTQAAPAAVRRARKFGDIDIVEEFPDVGDDQVGSVFKGNEQQRLGVTPAAWLETIFVRMRVVSSHQ